MSHDLTHASFFSGVGGLDMGLERAGWRTVSFSEVDPYASAVLAQRWPGVPNLGSIVDLAGGLAGSRIERGSDGDTPQGQRERGWRGAIPDATLWSGGFPCQDLSVAGKRRGMVEGTRSGLAYSFLALAERYRPRFVLLENVPGLLSSHGGRDMAALLGALVELGYGVGYRVLDARYFGVPQRRRRVFILGVTPGGRAGAELAAEVLSVGSRCGRHPATGIEAGEDAATGAGERPGYALRARQGGIGQGWNQDFAFGASPDPGRVRAPDGVAGRAHDRGGVALSENQRGELLLTDVAHQLTTGGGKPGQGYSAVLQPRVQVTSGPNMIDGSGHHRERMATDVTPTVSGYEQPMLVGELPLGPDDPLLPLGLDSHRYRCCGNGVVSDVSEWIGNRLREALA